MTVAETLQQRLATLHPTHVELQDDSADHLGHAGAAAGGGHFSVTIVSEELPACPRSPAIASSWRGSAT